MSAKLRIYDSASAKELSLHSLIRVFRLNGVGRIFFKILAPNDNSKNQIYLAGHFTDLGFIPTAELIPSASSSLKSKNPKRKIKFIAPLKFQWISPEGFSYPAPAAKLIYYPQFPEVRLSGFVAGCSFDMAGLMDPGKRGRTIGRVLFFAARKDGVLLAFLATPGSRLSKEIHDVEALEISNVLRELPVSAPEADQIGLTIADEQGRFLFSEEAARLSAMRISSKQLLLSELKRIHLKGLIPGKRLNKHNETLQYSAQNGGGYTLEAEFGITPNGYAEPDFHGWELKQFGVSKCHLVASKPLTVMTPEPDGGFYVNDGVEAFIRKYGYQNEGDRLDFTGRHFVGSACDKSGLTLVAEGFNHETYEIEDANGFIGLSDRNFEIASKWTFSKLLEHWKKKHSKAVYIPSVASQTPGGHRGYSYCKNVRLFEGTDIVKLLKAFVDQAVYYDPGINMKQSSTKPVIKRRSQFRIKSSSLSHLYENEESIDVLMDID